MGVIKNNENFSFLSELSPYCTLLENISIQIFLQIHRANHRFNTVKYPHAGNIFPETCLTKMACARAT